MVWFTVQLADEPGSIARLATALADRGINITGIIGLAEDNGGALMLSTSQPAASRDVLAALGLDFEEQADDEMVEMAASPGSSGPPGGAR